MKSKSAASYPTQVQVRYISLMRVKAGCRVWSANLWKGESLCDSLKSICRWAKLWAACRGALWSVGSVVGDHLEWHPRNFGIFGPPCHCHTNRNYHFCLCFWSDLQSRRHLWMVSCNFTDFSRASRALSPKEIREEWSKWILAIWERFVERSQLGSLINSSMSDLLQEMTLG